MNKKHLQCLSDSLTLRPLNWIWKLFFLLSFSTFCSRLQPSTYYHFISGWSATVLMNLLISVLVVHVCPADNNSTKILQTFWQRPFRWPSAVLVLSQITLTLSCPSGSILFTHLLLWLSILYTRHLLHVCLSWEGDPSSVALPEVSSIFLI